MTTIPTWTVTLGLGPRVQTSASPSVLAFERLFDGTLDPRDKPEDDDFFVEIK
jgi:hypothetical protein